MPPTCKICQLSRKERTKIEAAILENEPMRNIALRAGVSHTSVFRHKQHLPTQAIAKQAAAEVQRSGSLFDMWQGMRERFERIANDAQRDKDRRGETAAMREQIRLMDLAVRSASELKKSDTTNAPLHAHADWSTMAVVLATVLADHPEALDAVREGLAAINEGVQIV